MNLDVYLGHSLTAYSVGLEIQVKSIINVSMRSYRYLTVTVVIDYGFMNLVQCKMKNGTE